jgi:hypothetical protein
MFSIVTHDSGSIQAIFFNIVDNYEQCWRLIIVPSCYTVGSEFLGMWLGYKTESK